jgi:uncharacterized protein (TIGR00369 family)
MKLEDFQKRFNGTLAATLGMRITHANAERVVIEMNVGAAVATVGGGLHGGAMMALADSAGALGAFLSLKEGYTMTTTIESKTNFFASVKAGVVRAEAVALHKGCTTSVWQTRILDEDDRMIAQTLQTQLALKQ